MFWNLLLPTVFAQEYPPIVGGQTTDDYKAVGQLFAYSDSQGGFGFCSATLIHQQYVLTAAHCIAGDAAQSFQNQGFDIYFVSASNVYQALQQGNADAFSMVSSMDFVRTLLVDHKIVPEEATSALVTSLFIQHKLAYVVSGPWFLGELKSHKSWGVTALPVVSEAGRPAKPYLGVEGILMSARSRNKTDAFRLMRFLTRDNEARERWTESQQLVANRLVFDDPKILKSPFAKAFQAQLKRTLPLSNRPEMKRVWAPMKRALGQGVTRGRPIDKALLEAEIAVRRFDK